GPSIPRRDRMETQSRHARLMLILFKPWKSVSDLREDGQSWIHAFNLFHSTCTKHISDTIDNMQVLHECKDSRDD
ncbi:hypothetical protein BDQ17DRAFT_1185791, partial [Cyathus striatus]